MLHLPVSGNSKLQVPCKPACVPVYPCSTGAGNVVPPQLEEGLLEFRLEGIGMGQVKLLLRSCFCHCGGGF